MKKALTFSDLKMRIMMRDQNDGHCCNNNGWPMRRELSFRGQLRYGILTTTTKKCQDSPLFQQLGFRGVLSKFPSLCPEKKIGTALYKMIKTDTSSSNDKVTEIHKDEDHTNFILSYSPLSSILLLLISGA